MILPIWQPVGYSTHIIAKKVSEKYGVKTSHTGTLDPMAEGVIIVLLGEERHKKYEFAAWEKEYEFEIAFGISTDTYDGLGLIVATDFSNEKVSETTLNNKLKQFAGKYEQTVPPYSAIKIKGKPLHWYARNNLLDEINLPQRSGNINNIKLLDTRIVTINELTTQILNKIDRVSGDLRQKEVKQRWMDLLNDYPKQTICVAKIMVNMSKGLYVRSLSQDISKSLNKIGFILSITRTANGIYNKSNSKSFEELFGHDYQKRYDFKSKVN